MRRAAFIAAGALALLTAAPASAELAWHPWRGVSGDDAGHGVVSHGEAIWTNYLYDDYGANVDGFQSMDPDLLIGILSPHAYPGDPTQPVGFAPSGNVGRFRHTGDYGYPPDKAYPQDPADDPLGDNNAYDNVANVSEVRVALDKDRDTVFFHFALTDLGKDTTVIGLALDTDANAKTGGGAWPFSAGLSSAGWERFLTVWGSGGALTTAGGATKDLAAGAVREDLLANTIDVRVPLAALAGGLGTWRLVAGTGRWDATGRQWAVPEPYTTQSTSPGSLDAYPRVYELPFHHDEPNSLWDETKQANDLKAGTVDTDDWTVNLGQLASGATVKPPCRTGPREESFATTYPKAVAGQEGLTALPTQNGGAANVHNVNYIYRWHREPLALMLPPSSCDPHAAAPSLDLFFHPANVNQNAWLVGVEGDHDRVNYLDDPPLSFSYVTALAQKYNRITAAGLGRTEGWNYGDAPGEERADWDAYRAVTRRHRYDHDRMRVVGMSGRLGAPFFAETWPDRVSSIFAVSPHTADRPQVMNLRNTPWVFMHGTQFLELDSDLPSYDILDKHLDTLGYQYLQMTWNGRGHDFGLVNRAYAITEPWTSAPRIHPARITYYTDPKDRRPGLPLFPGVDWARSLSLADPAKPAQIDLTDLAKADRLPVRQTRFSCSFLDVATSDDLDYHGLSYETPEVLAKRMPDKVEPGWQPNGDCTYKVTQLKRPKPAMAVTGTLVNVSRLTLDLRRMGIPAGRRVDLSAIRTTTPVTVRLVSGKHVTVRSIGA